LERLPAGKVKKIEPRLSRADIRSLLSAARWRQRGLHRRNTPEATFVWLGGVREGFEKYRRK
jgi:hypothetical protein